MKRNVITTELANSYPAWSTVRTYIHMVYGLWRLVSQPRFTLLWLTLTAFNTTVGSPEVRTALGSWQSGDLLVFYFFNKSSTIIALKSGYRHNDRYIIIYCNIRAAVHSTLITYRTVRCTIKSYSDSYDIGVIEYSYTVKSMIILLL